jgi:hypothetical protein
MYRCTSCMRGAWKKYSVIWRPVDAEVRIKYRLTLSANQRRREVGCQATIRRARLKTEECSH